MSEWKDHLGQIRPSDEDIKTMVQTGHARATDGCRVTLEGKCRHGFPSWPVELGYDVSPDMRATCEADATSLATFSPRVIARALATLNDSQFFNLKIAMDNAEKLRLFIDLEVIDLDELGIERKAPF